MKRNTKSIDFFLSRHISPASLCMVIHQNFNLCVDSVVKVVHSYNRLALKQDMVAGGGLFVALRQWFLQSILCAAKETLQVEVNVSWMGREGLWNNAIPGVRRG